MVALRKTEGVAVGMLDSQAREQHSFVNSELEQRSPQANYRLIRTVNVYPRFQGRPLSTVSDQELAEIAGSGVHGVWLMGILERSEASRLHNIPWRWQYAGALPDVSEEDVIGSAFAPRRDSPDPHLVPEEGGWMQVQAFVQRVKAVSRQETARLSVGTDEEVLVFTDDIANHVAIDSPLVTEHPDWFVHGDEEKIRRDPPSYFRVKDTHGQEHIIAKARNAWGENDMAWADDAQFKVFHEEVIAYHRDRLVYLAQIFDGVRIDFAPIVTPGGALGLWRWHLTWAEVQQLEYQQAHPETQLLSVGLTAAREEAGKHGKTFDAFAETYDGYGQNGTLLESVDSIYEKGWYDDLLEVFQHGRSIRDFTRNVRNNLPQFRYATLFAANHDEHPLGKVLPRDASLAFLNILGILPALNFLIDDLQETGYSGDHIPMQVRRLPQVVPDGRVQQAHYVFYRNKASRLLQTGIYDIPLIKQPDDRDWSGEHDDIFQLRATSTSGKEAVIVCANVRAAEKACRINVPINATNIRVMDGITGEWLPAEIVDSPHNNGFLVILPPHGVQYINYTIN